MMRNRLYTKDEVLQAVETALSALDGIAAGIRAGVKTDLMEMVQFHPTTLISHRDKSRLFLRHEPDLRNLVALVLFVPMLS